jgi:nucleoside permease NupC
MVDQGVRTKWGRTTFGGGRFPAMAIAVPCGMVLGALLGLLAASLGAGGSSPVLTGAVFALCLAFPSTLLVYVLVVDRSTMAGAAEKPEESVESGWYDKAAAGALHDVVLVAGVTASVLAFLPEKFLLDPGLLLAGVVGLCFASFAVRYLLLQRRG